MRDLPELNGFRLLANSNVFMRDASVLRVERAQPVPPTGEKFRWFLSPAGTELLRTVDPLDSAVEAGIAAERAFMQAGRPSNYVVVDVGGGQRRLRLFDGSGVAAQVLAESTQSFASVAAANAALPAIAAAFQTRRIESSLSPMERRVAHYTGIRGATRRRALNTISTFFDTVDEPAPPGLVRRRWRLRGVPAGTGPVLLMGALPFDAATAALADAAALAAIPPALRYGVDEWNYHFVPPTGTGPFTVELREPAGNVIATAGATPAATYSPIAVAQAAVRAAVEHLYRAYGTETFYLLEHLLLRPRSTVDPFVSLPIDATTAEQDPYSQRISLVFPSGRARNFALPHDTVPTTDTTPDRFRDSEFRRHVEAHGAARLPGAPAADYLLGGQAGARNHKLPRELRFIRRALLHVARHGADTRRHGRGDQQCTQRAGGVAQRDSERCPRLTTIASSARSSSSGWPRPCRRPKRRSAWRARCATA